jgi:hypothetical protein
MSTTTRVAAALLGCAVGLAPAASAAAAGTTATAAAAGTTTTATTTDKAQAAAGWLAGQLGGPKHDHYSVVFSGTSYADDGETADAVLSMDAAGVAQTAAARATAWLAGDLANYAGTAPDYYPGSLAKLLLVADAQHVDVHHFGGIDLVAALHGEEVSSGLYMDPDTVNGYQSVLTQALSIVALDHTGSAPDRADAKAVSWLVGQECANGGFQNTIRTSSSAGCTPDVDTTGYVTQALASAGAATSKPLAWLATQRRADGGYPAAGATTSNANSTALAAQALLATGHAAGAAISWLGAHQQGCTAPLSQRGAIRYQTSFAADTALRATSQAAAALAQRWLGNVTNAAAAGAAPTLLCAAAPARQVRTPAHRTTTSAGTSAGTGASASAGIGASATAATAAAVTPARPTLPMTGPAPVAPTLLLAAGLGLAGTGLVTLGRRRAAPAR